MMAFLFALLLSVAFLIFGCACSVYIHLHNGFRREMTDPEDYRSLTLSPFEYE